MSADEMMRALLGSKHKGSMDLRGNLKSVKKEDVKQDKVTDSRLLNLQYLYPIVLRFQCEERLVSWKDNMLIHIFLRYDTSLHFDVSFSRCLLMK